MTPTALQALRRLLFFSVPEAALLIGATADQPHGIPGQDWQQWENGELPIPESIIARINELNEWRSLALDATADNVRLQMREKSGLPEFIFITWYDTLDDWMSIAGREPAMWRVQQSVSAALMGMFSLIRPVCFDPVAYHTWLGNRGDSEALRAEWASSVS